MVFEAIKEIGDLIDEVRVDLPDAGPFDIVARITGTFVGTLRIQRSADGKTYGNVTARNINTGAAADPTAPATVQIRATAADKSARVNFSAYTSGKARCEVAVIRV